jgi:hypothetical protein
MTDLVCRSSDRRAAVRAQPQLTGIDEASYLRYADDDGIDDAQPRRPRLRVRLLGDATEAMVRPRSWVIEGGRRVRGLRVRGVGRIADPEGDTVLELDLDEEGDASTYTVRVVRDRDRDLSLPAGVDPRYDRAAFSFKVDCPSDLDCAGGGRACAETGGADGEEPLLDYTAKDYASFRQLLLERLSLVLPAWRERSVPDLGMTLIELMAYVGDHLSYRQDVIATEAYLETARLRRSLRRHARLVDYAMHEGANARAWVTVCVEHDVTWPADGVAFYTRVPGWPALVDAGTIAATTEPYEVFLPVREALRDPAHVVLKAELGRIRFYTWGSEECCLPRGATRATLQFPAPAAEPLERAQEQEQAPLAPGDVLILEEVLDPETGEARYADPSRRHAVRLTAVTRAHDPLAVPEPGTERAPRLYDVTWMAEDALPFPLCVSSLDAAGGCAPIHDVSVARGNVILVDHGSARVEDELGRVTAVEPTPRCDGPHRPTFQERSAARFRAVLPRRPLTFRGPLPAWSALGADGGFVRVPPPASVMLHQDPRAALPDLDVVSWACADGATPARCPRCGTEARAPEPAAESVCASCGDVIGHRIWTPRRDLLDSSADDPHVVVEMDDEGEAHLRFGDGVNGLAPEPWTRMRARYRIGNGPAGNVPSEAIGHVAVRGETGAGVAVRNPLPAAGGVAPEPVQDVRLLAPASLRDRRERAVIAEDYAELALRDHAALQRAAGALRWTGSWYEVLVGLDPRGSAAASPLLRATVERALERYRRIGHDLRVETARYVPVRLHLRVCARPEYVRGHVRRAVLDALAGRDGFFHPDRFTFGQPLALSAVVAAVQAVPGVLDVTVLRLERLGEGDHGELAAGELRVGSMEIVQLENDPAMPDHGVIDLVVGGGR